MSIVTIRCPNTGCDIPSGIEADPDTFSMLPVEVEITCPACGQAHTWFTPSARTREYKSRAAFCANQAGQTEWVHTRELWQILQDSYVQLAEFERHEETNQASMRAVPPVA